MEVFNNLLHSLSLVILYNQPYLLDFFTEHNFPLLEKLSLESCFGLKQLRVSCRVLQELTLKNSLQLDSLEVYGLSHAYKPQLGHQSIEILSRKKGLVKNHTLSFRNMRFLELQTRFNRHNVQALSCLFKSCPMLNTLVLKIINDQTSERRQRNKDLWDMSNSDIQYWESQAYEVESFLKHLEFVEIHGSAETWKSIDKDESKIKFPL
ncbi:unnamed protein product [Cochlearia groenlandica]